MHTSQLEAFVLLAETEHMTKAAKQLNTSQPNLSYTISELEKELGVPLFKKMGRNIRLTQYGKLYYDFALKSLHALKDGETMLKNIIDPDNGLVKLGFIFTMGEAFIPSLTRAFLKDHPNVQFEFTQSNSFDLIEGLANDQLDLAICSQTEDRPDIQFTPLLAEELVIVVPSDHPLANQETVSLAEASHYPFVYYDKHSGLRAHLDQLFANLPLTKMLEVENDQTILGFVAQRFGIAIMPRVTSIEAYDVKILSITDQLTPRNIYLATRTQSYLSPLVKQFIQTCLDFPSKDQKRVFLGKRAGLAQSKS